MKTFRNLSLLLTAFLSLTAASSFGTTFTYSYFFEDGLHVSGKLDGTANGNFIDNVSNVSVFFDGMALPGTFYASKFDGLNYLNGAVVSFDALQNNFLFATSDLAGGDLGYESLFYMLNASVFDDTALASSPVGAGYASQDLPTSQARWSLNVPESGSTLALMSIALAGLAWTRRKKISAEVAGGAVGGMHAVCRR